MNHLLTVFAVWGAALLCWAVFGSAGVILGDCFSQLLARLKDR